MQGLNIKFMFLQSSIPKHKRLENSVPYMSLAMNENELCLIVENLSNDDGDPEDIPSQNKIYILSVKFPIV